MLAPVAAGHDQLRSATIEHTPYQAGEAAADVEGAARPVPNGSSACAEHIAHEAKPTTLLVAPSRASAYTLKGTAMISC
jgi:hypothetical protein